VSEREREGKGREGERVHVCEEENGGEIRDAR
jgi:hypothetical protein